MWRMMPRFLTLLTGRNVPKIVQQAGEAAPSIINKKTVADVTRVVEQSGILKRAEPAAAPDRGPT
jgi:hypothetical protein